MFLTVSQSLVLGFVAQILKPVCFLSIQLKNFITLRAYPRCRIDGVVSGCYESPIIPFSLKNIPQPIG